MQGGSSQGWTLLEALERTADPAAWDAYTKAMSEWEKLRRPVPSGPGSYFSHSPVKIESLRQKADASLQLIRSNFRQLLLDEKLLACGSRNGPSEPPTEIHAAGWTNLAWPNLQYSKVKERVGSKTKIYNVRVLPILHSTRAPHLLNGLSLADAFRKYVIEDPEVVALGKRVIARCGYRDVFEEGQAPGPIVDFHWSLGLSADEIASNFVYLIAWSDSTRFPEPSPQILDASGALADRCQALRRLLASGQIAASGTFAQTGMTGVIDRMQWRRSGVTVEVRNGDLCEEQNHRPIVRWSGIVLETPYTTGPQPTANAHTANAPEINPSTPPTASEPAPERSGKTTAGMESISEALKALWPESRPPGGIQVQQRDAQIIEWQRKNNRTVVSPRSIRRYLSRDGLVL